MALKGPLVVAVLIALAAPAGAGAQPMTPARPRLIIRPQPNRLERVEMWMRALVNHSPGETDTSLLAFGDWSAADWQEFFVDAQVFSQLMYQPAGVGFNVRELGTGRTRRANVPASLVDNLREIACVIRGSAVALGCGVPARRLDDDLLALATRAERARVRGDESHVLRLAALLHVDLATWGGAQVGNATRLSVDVTDGRGGGTTGAGDTLHWELAYAVVDTIVDHERRRRPRDPNLWTREWYALTLLWMQRSGRYDPLHLERALRHFPDDAELLFLSACHHEIEASPIVQTAVGSLAATLPRGALDWMKDARGELRGAESDLRKALALRPDWGEAHLRLGRVLWQLGHREEATGHLQIVLDRVSEPAVEYLAALFLGAAREDAGQFEAARALYERAAASVPSAQSPIIALSQLARRRGNRAEALRVFQPIVERDSADASPRDPWWDYLTLQTRDLESRLRSLRAFVLE